MIMILQIHEVPPPSMVWVMNSPFLRLVILYILLSPL